MAKFCERAGKNLFQFILHSAVIFEVTVCELLYFDLCIELSTLATAQKSS